MAKTLLESAGRYAEAHADMNGVACTLIPGLRIIRETLPGELQYAVSGASNCAGAAGLQARHHGAEHNRFRRRRVAAHHQ